MSRKKVTTTSAALLDLWRPPRGAGDPLGCIATTYTFDGALFEEHCLARFLEIESEPNRESLAYLLDRESRLGSVYAGVLVDHTQAGVEHSLRWDVLPVRIRGAKQHAKLSLLSWSNLVRVIVTSANLTVPGYRSNHEVVGSFEFAPEFVDRPLLQQTLAFLESLVSLVPGAERKQPIVARASQFLDQVRHQTEDWQSPRRSDAVRIRLVCTLPPLNGQAARSTLDETIHFCRDRGGSPWKAMVASPFYDQDASSNDAVHALKKTMARGQHHAITLAVPAVKNEQNSAPTRLLAPQTLFATAVKTFDEVTVCKLPEVDAAKNHRPWHAKVIALRAENYLALMIGSSNFTGAGLGLRTQRNSEANLIYFVEHVEHGRDLGKLEASWPHMEEVPDPEDAEWIGSDESLEEEEQPSLLPPLPAGFLQATYCVGERQRIVLELDPPELPLEWSVSVEEPPDRPLITSASWSLSGQASVAECEWSFEHPPKRLRVHWEAGEAFWPVNAEDSRTLPVPPQLREMSADEMLLILASADSSAALRAWAQRDRDDFTIDHELDAAIPIELDPLKRHDLSTTFLHRTRRRARILAQWRSQLERPARTHQALEWRLRGFLGVAALGRQMLREFQTTAVQNRNEALLSLADFLIVLREVQYQEEAGSVSAGEFRKHFRPLLRELASDLQQAVEEVAAPLPTDLKSFWERVVARCQE